MQPVKLGGFPLIVCEGKKMMEEAKQYFRKIYINHPTYKTPDGFDPVFEAEGQRGIFRGEYVEIHFQHPDVMYKDGRTFADNEYTPSFPSIIQGSDEDIEWIIDANKICWLRRNRYEKNWWAVVSVPTLIYEITGEVLWGDDAVEVVEAGNQQIDKICEITGWEPKWMKAARRAGWGPVDK